jgi:uncharacterized membrane protein
MDDSLARSVHIGGGFGAVALGLIVMFLPKFGQGSVWHRWLGRVYVVILAISCLVGIPLAYQRDSSYLMILGLGTFFVIAFAWREVLLARRAMRAGNLTLAEHHLRWHVILFGSSYIAAWSGFFANNFLFGTDAEWKLWFYAIGPSVIGAPFIAVAAQRVRARNKKWCGRRGTQASSRGTGRSVSVRQADGFPAGSGGQGGQDVVG